MGKFRSCTVCFKDKKEVYRDGELVSGVMFLDVLEPVVVKGVRIYCYGEALTKWSKEFTRDWNSDQIGQEKYFASVVTVFGKKVNEDGPNKTLTVGKHRWTFAFRLPPERLPSSFEGEYGAVRWFLKVEVDKPFPSINNRWFRAFTVLSFLDINEPVYQKPQSKAVTKTVSKALGLGNAGTLKLSAKTDRFGYCCGERILLTVEAVNESSKDMGKVSATLVQQVVFTANDETKSTNFGISSMETEMPLAKGTTIALRDLPLPIPAVPPSTRKRTCHIISCTYNVKVVIHVPWGLNLEAVLPLAIGTVPIGKRAPPRRPPARQAPDPATMIQYMTCETGIVPCHKCHNNFPNFPFVPATAYATSLTGVQPTTSVPQGAAAPVAAPSGPITAAGIAMPGALPPTKAVEASITHPPAPAAARMATVLAGALPPYIPSAPVQEDNELPPSYEDVVKMDEDCQQTSTSNAGSNASAATATSSTASTKSAAPPKGKPCAMMLVRFPDSQLEPFRNTIQKEQNNLLDSEEAFLAALAPQPITGLERPHDEWPERSALAVLVFPDMRSGEEWLKGVSERGDIWYDSSDAFIMLAEWHGSTTIADERLIFTVATIRTKEESTKERLTTFSKAVPILTKLRVDCEGLRQATTKKGKMLHGSWIMSDQTVSVTHWPKLDNYFSYRETIRKNDYLTLLEEFQALFESHLVLVISENLTSLSTQPTLDDIDDEAENVLKADDKDKEDDGDEDDGEKAENLLVSEDHFKA